jgi:hypothetical protein
VWQLLKLQAVHGDLPDTLLALCPQRTPAGLDACVNEYLRQQFSDPDVSDPVNFLIQYEFNQLYRQV